MFTRIAPILAIQRRQDQEADPREFGATIFAMSFRTAHDHVVQTLLLNVSITRSQYPLAWGDLGGVARHLVPKPFTLRRNHVP